MNSKILGAGAIGAVGLGVLLFGGSNILPDLGASAGGDGGGIPLFESTKKNETTEGDDTASISEIISGLPSTTVTFPEIPSYSETFSNVESGKKVTSLPYIKEPYISTPTSSAVDRYGSTSGSVGGGAGTWDESATGGVKGSPSNPIVDAAGFLFGLTPLGAGIGLAKTAGDFALDIFGGGTTKKDAAAEDMITKAVKELEPPELIPNSYILSPPTTGDAYTPSGARQNWVLKKATTTDVVGKSVQTTKYGEVYGGSTKVSSAWSPYQQDVASAPTAAVYSPITGNDAYHVITPVGTMLSGSKKNISYLSTSKDAAAVAFRARYGGEL